MMVVGDISAATSLSECGIVRIRIRPVTLPGHSLPFHLVLQFPYDKSFEASTPSVPLYIVL